MHEGSGRCRLRGNCMEGPRNILDCGEEVHVHSLWTDLPRAVESRGEKDAFEDESPHLACFLTRISGLRVKE